MNPITITAGVILDQSAGLEAAITTASNAITQGGYVNGIPGNVLKIVNNANLGQTAIGGTPDPETDPSYTGTGQGSLFIVSLPAWDIGTGNKADALTALEQVLSDPANLGTTGDTGFIPEQPGFGFYGAVQSAS